MTNDNETYFWIVIFTLLALLALQTLIIMI